MPLEDYREGDAFLIVEPGRYTNELKVVRSTQKVPRTIAGDAVVIRVRIRVPKSAFRPTPVDVLVVDEDLVRQPEVEALDPSDDALDEVNPDDAATWSPDTDTR